LKRIALVLCAALALGAGAVAVAQGTKPAEAAAGSAVGTARAVDETTLTLGDSGVPARAAATAAGSSTLAYFLRMIVVLALVLAAIYGVYRLLKRLTKPKTADDSAVKVLASTPLGAGKALHVVSLGSKAYLIGASDSSINLVAEIQDKDLIDSLILQAALTPASRAAGRDFSQLLSGLLGSRRGQGRAGGGRQQHREGDFLAGQRERLRKF
jgi:flagellar protein FliO/FliZ